MGSRLAARRGMVSIAALAVAGALGIAACGGSSTPNTPITPANALSRAQKFEQCLKAHGVTHPPTGHMTTAQAEALGTEALPCLPELGIKGVGGAIGNALGGG